MVTGSFRSKKIGPHIYERFGLSAGLLFLLITGAPIGAETVSGFGDLGVGSVSSSQHFEPRDRQVSYFDLGLKQNRYMSEAQTRNQNANYSVLSGDLNLQPDLRNLSAKMNIFAEGALDAKNEFYFGVPEAYIQSKKLTPRFEITVGRQKRHWSRLDEEFNLGVWQPQLRWDYLAPKQQGLVGLFFDWQARSDLQITLYTSPLFLPDQGPNFQLEGGHFTSSNRWFVPPQSRLQLFQGTPYSQDAPLYFELDRPAEEDIVMNSSFGMNVRYEDDAGPFWGQVSYAFKPRNQIHLGIECENCARVGGANPVEVTAVVHPVIVKHNVFTAEGGFNRRDDRGWLSFTGDFPNSSGLPADYEEAPLNSMFIAGASYAHVLPVGVPSWLQASYMRVFDLQNKDRHGLTDSDEVQSSLDRYPYTELAALDWKILLSQRRSDRLEWGTRYSYSIPERGGWISSSVTWSQKALSYSLGVDILGSETDPSSARAGLFTRYRTNDRVYGGVGYVF